MSLVAIVRWRISKKDPMIYENIGIFIGKKRFSNGNEIFLFFFPLFLVLFCSLHRISHLHLFVVIILLFMHNDEWDQVA